MEVKKKSFLNGTHIGVTKNGITAHTTAHLGESIQSAVNRAEELIKFQEKLTKSSGK